MADPATPGAQLRPAIEAEARRLGFTLFGVTTPHPPAHYSAFQRWLEAGYHGEMAYLAAGRSRLRRSDPRQILPECQSIIVLGMHYSPAGEVGVGLQDALATPEREIVQPPTGLNPQDRPAPEREAISVRAGPASVNDPAGNPMDTCSNPAGVHSKPAPTTNRGRVASYAWGDDYHDLIPPRLERLAGIISALAGRPIAARGYSDSGPLLERDLAQRAGLGWIGKNTCLISPRLGSYFFMAELLLDLPLPPDPPFAADRCGNCTRCIDACPTGCILPGRVLDARRCLSYLTIELKGLPPPELRPAIKDWVFGCDICQHVCPWNRFAPLPADPALLPRPGLPEPDLPAELALTSDEFRQKFTGSPLKRAKRRGYLRNIALALGNSDDPAAVPALERCAREEAEPLVREAAEWGLENLATRTR